jgi:hypothetical protein
LPIIGEGQASDYKIGWDVKNISMALPAIFDWLSGKDASQTIAY